MFKTVENDNTGVIHAAYGSHAPASFCGAIHAFSEAITVSRHENLSTRSPMITCKNCRRMLDLPAVRRPRKPEVVINLVRMIHNNNTGIMHAVNSAESFPKARCGFWYGSQHGTFNIWDNYSSHLHVPGTEPTCKSCRKIMGLTPKVSVTHHDKDLLKDCLRLMKKSAGFIERAPIFDRLEKAIKLEEGSIFKGEPWM